MLPVHSPELLGALLLLAAAQAFFSVRLRWARRTFPARTPAPSVRVFAPCTGAAPDRRRAVEALLAQDYSGPAEFVFVVPSVDDPARAELAALLDGRPRARLHVAGRLRGRCSGKISDLLSALEASPAPAGLYVFVDCDQSVPPGWLAALTAPLAEPGVAAATSVARPAVGGGLASALRAAWLSAGVPYLSAFGVPCGQSLALRREDFDRWDVAGLWSRSLYEDLALYGALKGRGRVVFVREARPLGGPEAGFAELFATTGRWLHAFRVYVPLMWTLGALLTLAKLYILAFALRPPVSWGLLLALFGLDAVNIALASDGGAARAALCAPLLPFVHAWGFARSSFARELRWGGRTYHLRAPQDVRVADPASAAAMSARERWRLVATTMLPVVAAYLATNHFPTRPATQLPLTAADRVVPFVPGAVGIYLSHFIFLGMVFALLQEKENLRRVLRGMAAACVCSCAAFLAWPVEFPRAAIAADALSGGLLRLLYAVDAPRNCFPSLHVGFAVLAGLGLCRERPESRPAAWAWVLLIAASTLLTKQHYFVDVLAGGTLAFFCDLAVRRGKGA